MCLHLTLNCGAKLSRTKNYNPIYLKSINVRSAITYSWETSWRDWENMISVNNSEQG